MTVSAQPHRSDSGSSTATSVPNVPSATAGSLTLDRGLRAIEILADANGPLSIAQLAASLGVHRSSAYRILRTLEEHRMVLRDDAGLIRIGPKMVSIARGAAPLLTQSTLPEITALANKFGMTAFIAVLDADEVITLVSVEPAHGDASVAKRPGARHSALRGATGNAIESSLTAAEHAHAFGGRALSDAAQNTLQRGYACSENEVIAGVSSLAVPLRIHGEPPAALAVLQIGSIDNEAEIVADLHAAANRIVRSPY